MASEGVYPISFSTNFFYYFALLPGAVLALLLYCGYAVNHLAIKVGSQGLEIEGLLYGRTIPRSSLKVDEARKVNLDTEEGLRPVKRTNGAGLARLKYGWFKLANGEKALLVLTNPKDAVYVPTTDGYSLLLSPGRSDDLLKAIKE